MHTGRQMWIGAERNSQASANAQSSHDHGGRGAEASGEREREPRLSISPPALPRIVPALLLAVGLLGGWALAQPNPTLAASEAANLLGTAATVTATFENTSVDPGAVGYGPYIDVLLPAEPDPLTYDGASYLGRPLTQQLVPFGTGGQAVHPFAVDATGQPLVVDGPPGGALLVLTLPFGSVTTGQPAIDIDLDFTISADATVGTAIDVPLIPGFRYGANPLDDPHDDAPLRGATATGRVTPDLVRFSKTLLAPEGDTNVGDSFTYSYLLTLELAPGQTFENLAITDELPTALVIRGGSLAVSVGGAPADFDTQFTITEPGVNAGVVPAPFPGSPGQPIGPYADSAFTVTLDDDVDTPNGAPTVVSVSFDFYIPSVDANGVQAGAADVQGQELNQAQYSGSWSGNAGQPGGRTLSGSDSASSHITNEDLDHEVDSNGTIRLQKWVGATGNKTATVVPGDVVTYYLEFQVSDVSAFDDVLITDVLADGLAYLPNSAQLVSYDRRGAPTIAGPFAPGNVAYATNVDGSATLTLDVSNQLAAQVGGPQVLLGACVPDGFGGLDPLCLAGAPASTTGLISYQATVLNAYRAPPAGSSGYVVQNDELPNTATIRGEIVNVSSGSATGLHDSDPGTASVSVGGTSTSKRIAYIDGAPVTGALPAVSAGDLVTFELEAALSSVAFHTLEVSDYLPLPVFDVPGTMTFAGTCAAGTPPAAGQVCYAPSSDFQQSISEAPGGTGYTLSPRQITTDTTSNSFTVDFGSFAPTAGAAAPTTLVLWATLEVSDTALADGLIITNMLQASDANSPGQPSIEQELVQLQYTRPVLNISNGVIDVGGNTGFDVSGLLGATNVPTPLRSGTDDLQRWDAAYDNDVRGLDARDVVTYLVIVENSGRGKDGAYDVRLREHLPPELGGSLVAGSLQAHSGTGASLALPGGQAAAEAALFGPGGLLFPGQVLGRGVAENGETTADGSNILYLTYQVRLPYNSESGAEYVIDSEVAGYTAQAAGTQLTAPGLITDDVLVQVISPAIAKSIVSTSEPHTVSVDGVEQVAIGEIVRYRIAVDVAEGHTLDLSLEDALPAGLAYLPRSDTATGVWAAAVSTSSTIVQLVDDVNGPSWTPLPSSATAPISLGASNAVELPTSRVAAGGTLTIDLGHVLNDANTSAPEQILVEFNAQVLNTAANSGQASESAAQRLKVNRATAGHTVAGSDATITSNDVEVRVFEPRLSITKTATPNTGVDAGDDVAFTITFTNATLDAVTAFDVEITDELPPHVTYAAVPGLTLTTAGDVVGASAQHDNGEITVTATQVSAGGTITVVVPTTLDGALPTGGNFSNDAQYLASSLPGEHGSGAVTPGEPGETDGERVYLGSANANVDVKPLTPSKTIVSTSEEHTDFTDVAIGEVVGYRVVVTIPEGVNADFSIEDTLPEYVAVVGEPRLALLGNDLTVAPGLSAAVGLTCDLAGLPEPTFAATGFYSLTAATLSGAHESLTLTLGDIDNNTSDDSLSCVVLEYDVVVLDVAGNDAGDELSNSVVASANANTSEPGSISVNVVEPALSIAKSVDAVTAAGDADAGDDVTYTLEVTHRDTSSADAFRLVIEDQIPAEILNPAVETISPSISGTTSDITGNLLSVYVPVLTTAETLTITVSGTLADDIAPLTTVSNTAQLSEYHSLPVAAPNSRQSPVEQDTEAFTTRDLAITKAVQATSEGHTGGSDVVVGEVVRYRLSVPLPEGVTPGLVITDTLPAGLSPVTGHGATVRVAVLAADDASAPVSATTLVNVPVHEHGSAPAVLSDDLDSLALDAPVASITSNVLTIDLGAVTNDAAVAGAEILIVEYNAVVSTLASNIETAVLGNSAAVASNGRTAGSAQQQVTVHEPLLSIDKRVLAGDSGYSRVTGDDLVNADSGELVTFRVTLSNAAGAVAAHNVNVTDTVPAGFELRSVTVTWPDTTVQTLDPVPTAVDVDLATLEPGDSLTLDYTVAILGGLDALDEVENTASFTADTVQDPALNDDNETGTASGTPRNYAGSDTASVTVGDPVVGLAKELPAAPSTSDGGSYSFDLSFVVENLGELPLVGVQVTDDLAATFPAGSGVSVTAAEVTSVTVDGDAVLGAANPSFNTVTGGVTDTNLLTPDTLRLEPGEAAVILLSLTVQLDDADALGTYHNTAHANGETPGGISADEDPSSNGDDPEGPVTPTPLPFTEDTGLTLEKTLQPAALEAHGDGSYTVAYQLSLSNTGAVPLRQVQVSDDLSAVFGAGSVIHSATVELNDAPSSLVPNTGYDGVTDTQLLDASQSELAVSATQSLTLTVRASPANTGVPYTNEAAAAGTSPLGQTPEDDDSAAYTFSADPELTMGTCVASLLPAAAGPVGTYSVTLTVRLENTGDQQLGDSQATLDLSSVFADAASYTLVEVNASGGAAVAANNSYGSAGDWTLLPAGTTLYTADQVADDASLPGFAQYDVVVTVVPGAELEYTVTGSAQGQAPVFDVAPATGLVVDTASNWCDPAQSPDPDPSVVDFDDEPLIGVAKRFVQLAAVDSQPGVFDVTFEFAVRNFGNAQLTEVALLDDFGATFSDGSTWDITAIGATAPLVAATPAAATTNGNLLSTTSLLGSQGQATDEGTVTVVLRVTPQDASATYENTAVAAGTSPDDVRVQDDSVDGFEPDADGDGDPGNDGSPTPFTFETPVIGLAKGVPATFDFGTALGTDPAAGPVANPLNVGNGEYLLAYEFTVRNYGDVPLTGLELTDDLATQLAQGNPTAFTAVSSSTLGGAGSLTANPAYDGAAGTNILADGQTLGYSDTEPVSESVYVVVTLQPGNELVSGTLALSNEAAVQGTSPGGQDVTDDSNEGFDPDSGQPGGDDPSNDGDGDPSNNDGPTTIVLSEAPAIALAKELSATENLGTGQYRVSFELTVANVGDVNLAEVQVSDDLTAAFRGVSTLIESIAASGSLTAATDYGDALTSGELLDASNSTLAVGQTQTINLTVLVTPGSELYGEPFENSALATGESPAGAPVEDESNDGDTPDPDEDSPTEIVLSEDPVIGVAKGLPSTFDFGDGAESNPRNLENGTYEVAYELSVRNYGDVVLSNVSISDDLLTQLAAGNPTAVRAEDGTLTANSAYDGAAGVNALAAGQALDAAGSGGTEAGTVYLVVTLQPGAELVSGTLDLQNQAVASGTSPGEATPTDESNAGFDPDSGQPEGDDTANDGDGDPTNNDGPTTVVLSEAPVIAAAKTLVDSQNLGTGHYRVSYLIEVENQGDVNLSSVQVTDPFSDTFRGSSYTLISVTTAAPLTAADLADAQASGELLDPAASALLVGQSGTITVVLDVEPRGELYQGPFLNTATAEGTSPSGRVVEDASNDDTGPDPTPDPGDHTPTPLTLSENPVLGVAKTATVTPVSDGSYLVQFDFTITNYGDVEVRELQLTDDLVEAFGAGNYSVLSIYSPTLSTNSAAPDPTNADAFDGNANQELLQGVDTLAVATSATVQLRLRVTPATMGAHQNQADVHGTSPGERPVTDRSTAGTDPDPNGDDVPDEDTPTPVLFAEEPLVGLAKSAQVTTNDDGTFNVALTFTVRNMGDVPLRGLQISDPLDGIYAITDLTAARIFVESSTLTVNPNYDGRTDSNILLGNDTLAVGAERQVRVRLEGITPTGATSTTNTAVASGTSPNGTPTEDRSTDGLEPDPNGDGVPGEDVPTPIEFEAETQVALAKSGSVAVAADGSFDVSFVLRVANTGNTSLHGVQVRDSLADYYANTNLTPAQVSINSADFAVRAAYDGAAEPRLLLGTDSLPIGASGTITITLSGITPNPGITDLTNSAVANAAGPDGTPTDDTSNDGNTPEPGVDVPTVVELAAEPLLGVAKTATVLQAADSTYTVTFDLVLRNYGNTDLVGLSLADDLADFYAQAGLSAANIAVSSPDGLPLNPAYDGSSDTELLGAGAGLASGEAAHVTLQLTGLTVAGPTNLSNQAAASGQTPTGVPTLPELSTDGPDPDPNGNGDPTDDSEPTPVFLTAEPRLGLAKSAHVEQNPDGSYRIEFAFVLANMGNTHLENLSLVDDLAEFYLHTDLTPGAVSVSSPDLSVNPSFDGAAQTDLLAPGNELALGAGATVLLVLDPVNPLTQSRFENSATAQAQSPDGTPTEDDSQDGTDPDPDGDEDPTNNDDPTPVLLESAPQIGVAKSAGVVANANGSFDLSFEFVIGNYGNTALHDVQLRDDLSTFYDLTDLSAGHLTVTSPEFTVNPGYDGLTDLRLLAAGNSLDQGASGSVTLTLAGFFINGPVETFNTAVGTGDSPDGTPSVPDLSHNGPNPDPDGDGDPGNNNDPTPVRLGQSPRIGLAKEASNTRGADGSYTVEFTLLVRNYGDAPLADLSLTDSLADFYTATNLGPERISTESADLLLNSDFDGRSDAELLAPGNRLGVGEQATLTITLVNLIPREGVTRVDNLALARGTAPDGTEVADTSTNGRDPDPSGSGPNNHSTPTPVTFEELADMLLTKAVAEGPFTVGDRVPYAVTIINPNDVATAFDLTDILPEGTAYVPGTAAFEPANLVPSEGLEPRQDEPGVISWHAVVLPAGAQLQVTYELRVMPGAGDTLVNEVSLVGSTGFGAQVRATANAVAAVDQGVFELGEGLLIGRVYLDVDRDDTYSVGLDVPIEGARVILSNGWQAVTDEQGNYAFRDLEAGSWTVMVDEITAPYRPSVHPEQLRDRRQHLVNVNGLTVSDFPFQPPEGLVGAQRSTVVEFGPLVLTKRHVQLPDGVRVLLQIDFQGEWPAVVITDPVPGQEDRVFVVAPSTTTTTLTYELPHGTSMTDPVIEWSER